MIGHGRVTLAAVALLVVAGSLSSCGGDSDGDGAAETSAAPVAETAAGSGGEATYPANGAVAEVLSLDNNFVPQDITVAAGTEVRWENNGRNDHNVLPEGDAEATQWGATVEAFHPGDTYTHVFDRPGTYVYYCSIHGTPTAGMFGTITVTVP